MILRRLHNLRAQNWSAILLELGIVILGVFIGTWVANWNQERAAKAETRRMVEQLAPSLRQLGAFFVATRDYHAVTRAYADTAIAGWRREPQVSDAEFVIAAYQASQIIGIGTNGSAWANVLGADQLRRIDDLATRNELSFLMAADYSSLDVGAVNTPYRPNVRRLIPIEIQEAIRAKCGDRPSRGKELFPHLPPTCDLQIAPRDAAAAAAILRAQPQLMQDLQWHMAAEAALLANIPAFETVTNNLQRRSAGIEE